MILLTHVGNPIPNYVFYSIIHLRKYNPIADIVFITNENMQNNNTMNLLRKYNIIVIDANDYSDNMLVKDLNRLTWIKDLHPLGPPSTYGSQPNFWHLTMERIFYINAFLQKQNINNVLHIENDNVMFYDYNMAFNYCDQDSISCVHRKHYGEDSTLFSFVGIKNNKILHTTCLKMLELVALGEKKLQSKYGLSHISEMHLLNIIRSENDTIKYFPMLPGESEYIFDPYGYGAYLLGDNMNHGPGHIDITDDVGKLLSSDQIKLSLVNNIPYLSLSYNKKSYKIFNLHVHRKNIEKLL
jgi:hypothetical protein